MAEDTDGVIVVGAGPVGVLNALGLAKQGIPVTIVEREPTVVESPRAAVYHWAVLEGLDELGVLEAGMREGFTKQDYQYVVWSTGERIRWSMAPLERVERFPFNLHLGQNTLAKIVLKELEAFDHASVRWNTRVVGVEQDDDGVTVSVEGPDGPERLRAAWVIGADGAGSAVRKSLGLEFEGMTWPERFVATNVRFDFSTLDYAQANMQIDSKYGAIIVKLDAEGLWRCTYMEDAALPEDSVRERMPAWFEVVLKGASDYDVVQYSPYRMHQRTAPTYRVGRVVLAGDAAHATNPTGGYGLTSGLFDTYVLYPALGAVIHGRADESVLDEYSRLRRKVFLEVASPQASENKRVIYGDNDPETKERDLERLRAMVADPDLLWQRLIFPRRLRTPSLV